MTPVLIYGSGTHVKVDSHTASQQGSILVTLTCYYARAMFKGPVARRKDLRVLLVELLRKARHAERDRCIDGLLQICTSEGGPDGLDVAIDVLAQTGSIVVDYARDYLIRDISDWNQCSERAYEPNDDFWYILLRAVARAHEDEQARYRVISLCFEAASRGIREGVIEALADLGTDQAKNRLQQYADDEAQDKFIREIAQEALEDLES